MQMLTARPDTKKSPAVRGALSLKKRSNMLLEHQFDIVVVGKADIILNRESPHVCSGCHVGHLHG